MRACYTWHWHDDARDVVVVVDQRTGRSVTNDAETVIADLVAAGVPGDGSVSVIYQDSIGRWDGLAVTDGQFAGFYPLGMDATDEALAVRRARALDGVKGPMV